MNPFERDGICATAATAHADIWPQDKRAALVHGTSQRTQNRWRTRGRGSPVDGFGVYLSNCPHPHRMEAWVRVTVKALFLRRKTIPWLISRYHELREEIHTLTGEVNAKDVSRKVSWKDRAHARERMVAAGIELSAIERVFAEKRIPDREVFGS